MRPSASVSSLYSIVKYFPTHLVLEKSDVRRIVLGGIFRPAEMIEKRVHVKRHHWYFYLRRSPQVNGCQIYFLLENFPIGGDKARKTTHSPMILTILSSNIKPAHHQVAQSRILAILSYRKPKNVKFVRLF